jgi:membrane protein insertase Oxa1/YidC/SpoIIIJ
LPVPKRACAPSLEQAEALETGVKDDQQALQVLRTASRQYSPRQFPKLAPETERRYMDLATRVDQKNRPTIQYRIMDTVVRLVGGNHVLALFLISLGVTIALWPLRAKQYRSFKEMQKFAPQMKKIQEKYKDDPQLQQQKLMEFYKEHGYNPFAGCLPLIPQMPVLWGLYYAISSYQYQFTESTFLWINPALGQASADWPGFFSHAIARTWASRT